MRTTSLIISVFVPWSRAGQRISAQIRALALASTALVPLASTSVHAQAALTGLGTLDNPAGDPAVSATGASIAANGSIVVGSSGSATFTLGAEHGFSWTQAGGMVDLHPLAGDTSSFANGISADGTTIVGSSQTDTGSGLTAQSVDRPVFWRNGATNPQQLSPLVAGATAFATKADANGNVIVGTADRDAPSSGQTQFSAVMWSGPNFTIKDLGTLNNFAGQANSADVSSTGTIVVGSSELQVNHGKDGFIDTVSHGFWWTQATGMVDLSTLVGQMPGATSAALAVNPAGSTSNPSGSIVVGSSNTSGANTDAVLWNVTHTGKSTITDLGVLPGTNFAQAMGVTADGSIVVGSSQTFAQLGTTQGLAFRWTAATQMVSLNTFVSQNGVALGGISLVNATAITPDGQFIVANGTYAGSGTNTQPYVVRETAITPPTPPPKPPPPPIVGVTTAASVQASIDQVAAARRMILIQEFGEAAQLLGANERIGSGSEIGVFAAGGTDDSLDGGAAGRASYGNGFSILAGLAGGEEHYANVHTDATFMGALALRYIYNTGGLWRPYGEAGAWGVPGGTFTFTRTYANGSGTAVGSQTVSATKYYAYGRLGLTFTPDAADEGALSGEIGHGALHTGAFAEALSGVNPFEAAGASATDELTVGKIRAQWTRMLTQKIDATIWAAAATTFDETTSYAATVPGFGLVAPTRLGHPVWAEYGGRLGYKITPATVVDVYADGVSGDKGIGTDIRLGAGVRYTF